MPMPAPRLRTSKVTVRAWRASGFGIWPCGPLLLGSLDRFDRHRRSAGLSFDDDVCAGKLIKLGLIALEGVDLVSADKRESCPLLHALPCALRGALTLHHVLLAAHGIRDGAGDLLTGLRLNDDRGKGK